MSYSFAENVIRLKLLSDRLCEGKNKKNGLFLVTYQILFVLSEQDRVSPKQLVYELGLAKSNLAIIAKKMIKEGLILQNKDLANRKEIYYCITKKGKDMIIEKVSQIEEQCTPEVSKDVSLLEKVVKILKSVRV